MSHLKLENLGDISKAIGIPKFVLTHYVFKIDRYYFEFSIGKKYGRAKRKIAAPSRKLKGVQRWIIDEILRYYKPSSASTAYSPGNSIVKNAQLHESQEFVLNLDIKDFFPTISEKRVIGLFQSIGYSRDVAFFLGRLTTYQGRLPQGAPSSPHIANLICRTLDFRLERFCKAHHWNYSRYSDDITISGKGNCSKALEKIEEIILKEGFCLNARKTRTMRRNARQTVTGLVVNDGCNIPRSKRRMIRAAFHNATLSPETYKTRIPELEGYISFLNSISKASHVVPYYREQLRNIKDILKNSIGTNE